MYIGLRSHCTTVALDMVIVCFLVCLLLFLETTWEATRLFDLGNEGTYLTTMGSHLAFHRKTLVCAKHKTTSKETWEAMWLSSVAHLLFEVENKVPNTWEARWLWLKISFHIKCFHTWCW